MRKLIVAVVLLLAAALVADFGAAAYSEYRVSRALRDGGDLTSDPEVTIHGFPFVLQAARGEYSRVEIRAQDVPTELIDKTTIEATLRGVTLPLSDLIDGSVGSVPVDELDGRVRIDATDLGRFLDIPDLQVSAAPAEKSDGTGGSAGTGITTTGAVVLSGTVGAGPLSAEVSVTAELRLDGDSVSIVATDFYFGPQGDATFTIPDIAKSTVLGFFTKKIDKQQLPFGIEPTSVYAQGGQIVIDGEARNITIDLETIGAS